MWSDRGCREKDKNCIMTPIQCTWNSQIFGESTAMRGCILVKLVIRRQIPKDFEFQAHMDYPHGLPKKKGRGKEEDAKQGLRGGYFQELFNGKRISVLRDKRSFGFIKYLLIYFTRGIHVKND